MYKPIEYLQGLLYQLKCHWRAIVMTFLVTTTLTLGLSYAATYDRFYYNVAVGTGLVTVITAVVIFAPQLGKVMDRFGLREVPEDET